VYAHGAWLRDVNGNHTWDGPDLSAVAYLGWDGVVPVPGDWNGDQVDDLGVYGDGAWFLDANGDGTWDPTAERHFYFGWTGALPVAGDWNCDGTDDVGFYHAGAWFRDLHGNRHWDRADGQYFPVFGEDGALPVVGNWAAAASPHDAVLSQGVSEQPAGQADLSAKTAWLMDLGQFDAADPSDDDQSPTKAVDAALAAMGR